MIPRPDLVPPDSKRFILHRSAHPHGSDPTDPEHHYLLCDIENGYALSPLTEECGATGPSLSPDGRFLYYFVNETRPGGGRLTLKRVRLDGAEREALFVIDRPVPGTNYRPSKPYPLSTISSDGQRIAISAFLGDGLTAEAPWGLLVFDISRDTVELVTEGATWCNMHPQYTRTLDPDASHDILIQENHGNRCDPAGNVTGLTGGDGADIHVIRDDGSNMRDLPWGRDGNEFCQGHQCWRGRSELAITSTVTKQPSECRLIEGVPLSHHGHDGINTPGAVRNDLSRSFPNPRFYHFATDIEGRRLITDSGPADRTAGVYLARLPEDREGVLSEVTLIARPASSWQKSSHIHPFLSPDGALGFFNSDESGILQAYMVRGWTA